MLKHIAYVVLIVAGIGSLAPLRAIADDVPWPFRPQNSTHDISMTYGQHDYGRYPGRRGFVNEFHPGIDIPKPRHTTIVASNSGPLIAKFLREDKRYRWIVVGSDSTGEGYRYGHIDKKSIPKRFLKKRNPDTVCTGDSLGYIVHWGWLGGHHLEFQKVLVDANDEPHPQGNPLVHLTPNADSLWPVRDTVLFRTNEPGAQFYTKEQLEGGIHDTVDIVIQVHDHVPNDNDWKVAPYGIGYELLGPGDSGIPPRTFVKYGGFDIPLRFYQIFVIHDKHRHVWGNFHSYVVTNKDYDSGLYGSIYHWYTKQRREGEPGEEAPTNQEAEYPDGEYRVVVYMTDYNNDQERTIGVSEDTFIVDNFLPELRELTIKQGRRVIYNSDHPDNPDSSYGFVQPGFPLDFIVCFSEGMPTDSPPVVTYGLEPPYDADTVTTVGWDTTRTPCDTWIGTVVPDYSLEGDHQVHILAWDLAGNELDTLAGEFIILLEIYVADFWSDWPNYVNRIQVFDWYGEFQRQFTFEDLYHLAEVCVDKAGYCYVSGIGMAIHKFDRFGNFYGDLELELPWRWARGITTDNAFVYATAERWDRPTKVHKLTTDLSLWSDWDTEHCDDVPTLEYSSWSDRLFVLLLDRDERGWAELYDTTGAHLKTEEIIGGDDGSAQPAADTSGIYITTGCYTIQKHDFEMNHPPVESYNYWQQVFAMAADNLHLYVTGWPDPPFVGVIDKETRDTVRCFGEEGTGPGQFDKICGIALFPPLPEPLEMVPAASVPEKGKTVALSVQSVTLTPSMFALFQNYPNPCGDFTTIKYQLPKRVVTTLKIYDVSGRLVRTLADDESQAGAHSTNWNLRADNGCRVARGIYFYRLTAGDFTTTKKMVVLR